MTMPYLEFGKDIELYDEGDVVLIDYQAFYWDEARERFNEEQIRELVGWLRNWLATR